MRIGVIGCAGRMGRANLREVLGTEGYGLEFTECLTGNSSRVESPLMDYLTAWVAEIDPGAHCLPTISTGYSDSRTFRAAFPDCVAYGFFPFRHMQLSEVTSLPHARNERIECAFHRVPAPGDRRPDG